MAGIGFAIAGLLVGTAVGATGVGGGSLMTPVLILFYGISPALAVGTDLLYAAISKTFGVVLYRQKKAVDWPIVGWQALGSVPASLMTLYVLEQVGPSPALDHVIKLVLSIAIGQLVAALANKRCCGACARVLRRACRRCHSKY